MQSAAAGLSRVRRLTAWARRFGLALAPPALAVLCETRYGAAVRPHMWYPLYPALFISSWIGDWASSLITTILAVIYVWWTRVQLTGTSSGGDNMFGLVSLLATGVLFTVFHDRLRKTNGRLAAVNRTLRMLERMREEWASLVAHDLQQPINAIVLRSDLLLRSDLNERQRDGIWKVRTTAMRLGRMVNDLNDASQLEASRMRMNFVRVDLGALMRDLLDRVPGTAGRTTVRIPTEHVLFVRGDEQRLEQVMSNQLSNAIKYGTPGTQVVFELRERDGYAEVTVSNRGPGIPADELPRLFDRYMRSRTVSAEGPKGLGVGLYIAKGLVEAHGGRIWIESVPGDTTTFHFTIPLDGPPVARILPPPAAEPSRPQHVPSRP
jgi:signal transduction histidine kinase